MIEFLNSIWQWILENKDNILAFITSSDFVATMTMFAALVKSIDSTKKNTLSITSIKDTIKLQQGINDDVTNVKDVVMVVQSEVNGVKNAIVDTIDKVAHLENTVKQLDDELLTKVNAMLEVQNIVYSTIKDDTIRNTVNTILIAAKHSDAKSKAKLQDELDALREELNAKNAELDAVVTKMVEKIVTDVPVEGITTVEDTTEDIRRY